MQVKYSFRMNFRLKMKFRKFAQKGVLSDVMGSYGKI